jgi:hypothetical protein
MYPEISLYSEGGLALRLVALVFCSLPYQSVLLRFASLSLHSGYIAQFVPATDTGTVEQDCDVLAALLSATAFPSKRTYGLTPSSARRFFLVNCFADCRRTED